MIGQGVPTPFTDVVSAIRAGETAAAAAARLGLPVDLAEAIVEEALRLGVLSSVRAACLACASPSESLACARCPMKPRAPA